MKVWVWRNKVWGVKWNESMGMTEQEMILQITEE